MLALTAQQQAEVCRLRDEKDKSWAWTWGKDPAFTCCREGRLGDAPIRLAYRARHGIFSGVEVHCPLLDEAEAVRLLEGARLDLPELSGVCRRLAGDNTRPLLAGDGGKERGQELMTARDPLYREAADLIIDTDGLTPSAIAEKIQQKMVENSNIIV